MRKNRLSLLSSLGKLVAVQVLLLACNSNKPGIISEITATPMVSDSLPELPSSVVFRNWEMGDPSNLTVIVELYKAWDSEQPTDMVGYLGDSITFDWPNGSRVLTSKEEVEPLLRKWRNGFKSTSNTPVSLLSVHNKDMNQDWVIAWVWNRWETAQGKKDSMLFCDNWRIEENKVVYLNSSENRTSKSLSTALNGIVNQ